MLSFFIADNSLVSKQKLESAFKKKLFTDLILRNRDYSKNNEILSITKPKHYGIKCIITSGYAQFFASFMSGYHFSLFYDKILSKTKLTRYNLKFKKTASVHNLSEILMVRRLFKPNFFIISPIFHTETHKNSKSLGYVKLFKLLNSVTTRNFIVMGGISHLNYKRIINLDYKKKIKGFAGIRSFL